MKTYLKLIFCYACFVWILSVSYIGFASNSSPVFTEEKVSEIVTQLISNCDPSVCHSTDIVQLITHGSISQYHQILHILNEKGPLCLRFALEALKDKLEKQNRIPSNCDDLIGEVKKNCQNLQAEYVVVNDRVLSLVNLMVSQKSNLVMPFTQHLLEDETPSPYINTRLVNLLQRLEDERSCSQYNIGEEREFIITPFQSVIIPYTYYRVKRESEKHYKAFVVLEFSPSPSLDMKLSVPEDQFHNYYIQKVRRCIKQVNRKMKGTNGERLEIVIEDAQVNSCIPKRPIKVGAGRPANVKYYYMGMSCANITHELMHILGLWDEYIGGNYWPKYDCRVIQNNSMLSKKRIRWNRVFYTKLDDSLLDPSHFQSILYGNCSLRNDVKLYRRCSRLSYQMSKNDNACLAEKAYCSSQNVLGRDKITEQERINKEIQKLQADLALLEIRLVNNSEPSENNPDYSRIKAIRHGLSNQKSNIEKQISDLQRRLDFVLAWPDPSTP